MYQLKKETFSEKDGKFEGRTYVRGRTYRKEEIPEGKLWMFEEKKPVRQPTDGDTEGPDQPTDTDTKKRKGGKSK